MFTTNTPPIWPLPSLDGHAPMILSLDPRQPGVELGYADGIEIPSCLPVLAVGYGEIQYAGEAGIIVDHRNGYATLYSKLDHRFVLDRRSASRKRRERVNVGDALGFVTLPFHFEIWRLEDDYNYDPLDPSELLRQWVPLPWNTGTKTANPSTVAA